jgi:hypothetical protein
MSTLTTGGRLWSPHRHRHHPTPTQQPYLFGPASEIAEGSATNTAPSEVEGEQFLFWSVAGALSANGVQPPGQLTLSPVPIFRAGSGAGLGNRLVYRARYRQWPAGVDLRRVL